MDGNRRWAKSHGLQPWLGHKEGAQTLKETIKFCIESKIPYLSVYTLSLENLKRPQEELNFLFGVLAKQLASSELDSLKKYGVKVQFIGDSNYYPQELKTLIDKVEQETASGKNLTLSCLFCYGGRQELVAMAQSIATKIEQGKFTTQDINEETIKNELWTHTLPDADLIIRTGFVKRLSNFLPFQSAYSELYFIDKHWPEITRDDLVQAVDYILIIPNEGLVNEDNRTWRRCLGDSFGNSCCT